MEKNDGGTKDGAKCVCSCGFSLQLWVWCSRFMVSGLVLRVERLECRVKALGLRFYSLRFRVEGCGISVCDLGIRIRV